MGTVISLDRRSLEPAGTDGGAASVPCGLSMTTGDPIADAALGVVTIHLRVMGARLRCASIST